MPIETESNYDRFCPRTYLLHYYSHQDIPEDELLIFRQLANWLNRQGRSFETAVEVGCGPTLHHAFPLAQWVNQLILCDYVEANRLEVVNWLNAAPNAHDWRWRVAAVLESESIASSIKNISEREALLRSKVTSVEAVDLRSDRPLSRNQQFDLVTSFYTTENVACDVEDWKRIFSRLLSLCKEDGSVFTVLANDCTGYQVGAEQFPTVRVSEKLVAEALESSGFPLAGIEVRTFNVKGWEREGISSIIIAAACRS